MANLKKEERTGLEMALTDNFVAACNIVNAKEAVKASTSKLHEERIQLITDLGTIPSVITSLRTVCAVLPKGDEYKSKKAEWKKSVQRAFHKVHEKHTIKFKMDNPVLRDYTPKVEKTDLEKVTEILCSMFGEADANRHVKSIQKHIDDNKSHIATLADSLNTTLKSDKAATIEQMEKELAKEQEALKAM